MSPPRRKVCVTAFRAGCVDRVVLNNLSEEIRVCLQHAEDCARKAAELPNGSRFRQDVLNLEQRWLELARSIEFGESPDTFTKNSRKPKPMDS